MKLKRKFFNSWKSSLYWSFIILLFVLIAINTHIYLFTKKYKTDNVTEIAPSKTALVLGTAKYKKEGGKNEFFFNRLIAAVALYKAGKIDYFILSGDNSHSSYNEPMMMKKELLRLGVPENVIYLDFAGFSTLDSVIRCREIFGQQSFIIISQSFHNRRALYIARKNGINAFGFDAPDVTSFASFKTKFREIFARIKMMMDIYLFKTQPHFLGEQIQLGEKQVF
jgi:SanA protein